MIKIDYISTTDINKLAKIHSNKKYFNWIMKIVGDEYRFYPPVVIDTEEEIDDFDFTSDEDDSLDFDNLLNKKESIIKPMIGELWDNTTKFFTEDRFVFSDILESKIDKKMKMIKKCSNRPAKIEQYTVEKFIGSKKINKQKYYDSIVNTESYKLYKIKKNSNCLATINKYYDLDKRNSVSHNKAFNVNFKKFIKRDDIEILSLDESYI